MSAEQLLESDEAYSKRKRLMSIFAVIAVAVLILGLTLSWFVGSQTASTVGKIAQPSNLQILGPNSTSIEQLDLSYDSSNIDSSGKVTVRRGFCVESGGDPFELQVANTTNISGLDIKVYRVTVNDKSASGDVVEPGSYSWSKGSEVEFAYINKDSSTGIAKTPTGSNDETFANYTKVQANAAPLYRWHAFEISDLDKGSDGKPASVTNFIIEATWTETVKETDIVYLIARNTSTSTGD